MTMNPNILDEKIFQWHYKSRLEDTKSKLVIEFILLLTIHFDMYNSI